MVSSTQLSSYMCETREKERGGELHFGSYEIFHSLSRAIVHEIYTALSCGNVVV